MWGVLSDEGMGLQFTVAAEPRQQSFSGSSPVGLMATFYCLKFEITPTNREAELSRVMLRLTVSQSICLGVEPSLAL
jgi:hypothetical protein